MDEIQFTDIFTPEQIALHSANLHAIVDEKETSGIVYFVQNGDNGPIKIGYTRHINRRMRELRTKCGLNCVLLATRPGGGEREGAYHFQFWADHVEGEWFNPSVAILSEIERLKDGM